jgi:aspartyl-tRNA synthetase
MGELRTKLADLLGLVQKGIYRPLWVTDFPMFEYDDASERWQAMHHMFTMPKGEHLAFLKERPGDVRATLYDVVLNGIELGSGSVRITDPKLQAEIMEFVGYPLEKAESQFGFFLNAYHYGAPRHAGMALGLDNLVMTMLQLTNIQDVIAFPNASSGVFPLDGSPSDIDSEQWRELHLRPVLKGGA